MIPQPRRGRRRPGLALLLMAIIGLVAGLAIWLAVLSGARSARLQRIAEESQQLVFRTLSSLPADDPLRRRLGAFKGLNAMFAHPPGPSFDGSFNVESRGTASFERGTLPIQISVWEQGPLEITHFNIYPNTDWLAKNPGSVETQGPKGIQVDFDGGTSFTEIIIGVRHPAFQP